MFSLDNRLVLITGGGGILGPTMANALVRQGARVALVDRNLASAQVVADQINADFSESRAFAYQTDIADRVQLDQLRRVIEDKIGNVEVLVNNAATKSSRFFDAFEAFPLEDWDTVMRTNVTGVMLSCQVFGAGMAHKGSGSIINILSIYGIVGPDQRIYEGSLYDGRAINTPAVYSTSKAAVLGLTRYLATYWGERGVRVNAVTPGGIFSGQNEVFRERYGNRVPLGRMAQREEICGAVAFLASDASSYVTGHNLIVDGGFSVW